MKTEAVVLGALLFVGCGGGGTATPLPRCEQAMTILTAKTSDGAATISDLEIQMPTSTCGACRVLSGCVPRSAAHPDVTGGPCAEVTIGATGTATVCDLTFISSTGQVAKATVTVHEVAGTEFQCTSAGLTETAARTAFDPPALTIDFSMGVTPP
jgi:hypothetical protein